MRLSGVVLGVLLFGLGFSTAMAIVTNNLSTFCK